jgi:hypothetical protein
MVESGLNYLKITGNFVLVVFCLRFLQSYSKKTSKKKMEFFFSRGKIVFSLLGKNFSQAFFITSKKKMEFSLLGKNAIFTQFPPIFS